MAAEIEIDNGMNTKDDEQIYEKQNSICIRFGWDIIKK